MSNIINEGRHKKGGIGSNPKTERPVPPAGQQGGSKNNEGHTDEFTRRMSEIHLQLYHLMLDGETSWSEAAACQVVLDSFDSAWEKLQEYEQIIAEGDKRNE